MLGIFIFLLNLYNTGCYSHFNDEETGLKKSPCFWRSEPYASLWLISGVSSIWLMPNLLDLLSNCLHDISILMTNFQRLRQDKKQVSDIAPKAYLSHSLPHSVNDNFAIPGAETQNLSCPQLPQTPLWSLTSPDNSIFKIYPESGPPLTFPLPLWPRPPVTLTCIIKYPPNWFISALVPPVYLHKATRMILLKWRSDQVISLFKTFQWIPLWLRVRNKDP